LYLLGEGATNKKDIFGEPSRLPSKALAKLSLRITAGAFLYPKGVRVIG
jgi:hypothetical protein